MPERLTPADASLLLEAIAGVDQADPATADVPLGDVRGELRRGIDDRHRPLWRRCLYFHQAVWFILLK